MNGNETETEFVGRGGIVRDSARAVPAAASGAGRESACATGEEEVLGELTGKTVLITGATSGIGHAIAEHMAESGARVMLTGRNQAAGAALARELGARFIAGDIAEPAFPDRLVAETLAAFGAHALFARRLEAHGERRQGQHRQYCL